jgi:hypothetical protein
MDIDELFEHIKQECQKSLDDMTQKYKLSTDDEEKLDLLIKDIMGCSQHFRQIPR